MDLSSSHKKFSGQVLMVWTSQGMANPFWRSPLFQSHRAEQFSAHKASLIRFCSCSTPSSSVLVTTCLSISSWISSSALLTSSVFAFMSMRAQTSLMLDLRPSCRTMSASFCSICWSNCSKWSWLSLNWMSWAASCTCLRTGSKSSRETKLLSVSSRSIFSSIMIFMSWWSILRSRTRVNWVSKPCSFSVSCFLTSPSFSTSSVLLLVRVSWTSVKLTFLSTCFSMLALIWSTSERVALSTMS
mmetsp:Transcript_6885/g.11609  ORF Transcript_6885/g.11609 Transcript_6885/m.11609 type:complete len:243 (-) Transcript_6885:161-889(-)